MKPHLSIAASDVDRDTYIDECIADAEDYIAKYTRRDLDTEFPVSWPANLLRALRMLTAHYFLNRETIVVGATVEDVPISVKDILSLERNLE
jgi:Phage gp6-like head-tail connector protein